MLFIDTVEVEGGYIARAKDRNLVLAHSSTPERALNRAQANLLVCHPVLASSMDEGERFWWGHEIRTGLRKQGVFPRAALAANWSACSIVVDDDGSRCKLFRKLQTNGRIATKLWITLPDGSTKQDVREFHFKELCGLSPLQAFSLMGHRFINPTPQWRNDQYPYMAGMVLKRSHFFPDVLERYRQILVVAGGESGGVAMDIPLVAYVKESTPQHLIWMLDQLTGVGQSNTKRHRWLGYVQGIMVAAGLITVQEEREVTRGVFNGE